MTYAQNNQLLKGKKAIVTGASSGIGMEITLALLRAGVDVAMVSRSAPQALDRVKSVLLEDVGDRQMAKVKAYAIDFAEIEAIEAKVKSLVGDFGSVDILINNAGIAHVADVFDTSLADWQRSLDLNLTSVFQCIKAVLPTMRSQTQGTIINMGSIAAKQAFPGWGAYCATKFALLGLTQALAAEERSHGIKVMSICPGSVNTPLWDTLDEEVAANFDRKQMLNASTVAEAVINMLRLPAEAVITDLVLMSNAGVL